MSVEGMGWSERLMGWLRVVTQLVALNLLWLAGTAVGLVVLGAGPATAAASPLADAALRGQPSEHLVGDFVRTYRSRWARANALVAPFWAVAALVVADVAALAAAPGSVTGVFVYGIGAVALYATAAVAFLVPADERSDDTVPRTWRFALLAPAVFPATAVAVLLPVAVVALLAWTWPVVAVLVGVSLPLALTGRLVRSRLDALDQPQAGTTTAGRAGPL